MMQSKVSRCIAISAVVVLVVLVASYTPLTMLQDEARAASSNGTHSTISMLQPTTLVPSTMKLPWASSTYHSFSGGPHGAPIDFSCTTAGFNPSGIRPAARQSGLDFAMPENTPVLAVADGWVVFAATVAGVQGKVVVIDHGNDFSTQYWHLNETDVTPNTWISQGTVVGKSGGTTDSGGRHSHLHLEFRSYRDPNLPRYGGTGDLGFRDFSLGVPYPAHGIAIDGYTARTEILTDPTLVNQDPVVLKGLNYEGALTRGQETQVSGTACENTSNKSVTRWQGSQSTIVAGSACNTSTLVNCPISTNTVSSTLTPPASCTPSQQPSVYITRAWTADPNDTDPNGQHKTNFQLGDAIRFWAHTCSTFTTDVTSTFTWQAIGPRELMFISANVTVPAGDTDWYTTATVPVSSDAWEGKYSFRALATTNALSSGTPSDFSVIPPSGSSATTPTYYIVLTWDQSLVDLDAHLALPDGHAVYFGDTGNLNAYPWASLADDEQSSAGIETIGISQRQAGTYNYFVFNHGNANPLAGSLAAVWVYQVDQNGNGKLVKECQPPLIGGGSTWDVFQINSDGTLTNGCGSLITLTHSGGVKQKVPLPKPKHLFIVHLPRHNAVIPAAQDIAAGPSSLMVATERESEPMALRPQRRWF